VLNPSWLIEGAGRLPPLGSIGLSVEAHPARERSEQAGSDIREIVGNAAPRGDNPVAPVTFSDGAN